MCDQSVCCVSPFKNNYQAYGKFRAELGFFKNLLFIKITQYFFWTSGHIFVYIGFIGL